VGVLQLAAAVFSSAPAVENGQISCKLGAKQNLSQELYESGGREPPEPFQDAKTISPTPNF
jgi:hypothetical protein